MKHTVYVRIRTFMILTKCSVQPSCKRVIFSTSTGKYDVSSRFGRSYKFYSCKTVPCISRMPENFCWADIRYHIHFLLASRESFSYILIIHICNIITHWQRFGQKFSLLFFNFIVIWLKINKISALYANTQKLLWAVLTFSKYELNNDTMGKMYPHYSEICDL